MVVDNLALEYSKKISLKARTAKKTRTMLASLPEKMNFFFSSKITKQNQNIGGFRPSIKRLQIKP